MSYKADNGEPSPQSGFIHLLLTPQSRYLVGHGVEAVQDALDGMDRNFISIDNISAIYFAPEEFDLYFTRDWWPLIFGPTSKRDVMEFTDIINYMMRKNMIRSYSSATSTHQINVDRIIWNSQAKYSLNQL